MRIRTLGLYLGMMMVLVPAWSLAEEPPKELDKEVQELRLEIEELRAWKERVDAAGSINESVAPPGKYSAEPPASYEEDKQPRIQLPRSMSLKVSGEHRTRFEYKDQLYSPIDPMGMETFDFTHMRNRLRFDLDVGEGVSAVFELQDVRTWGEEGSTTADTEGVDLKRGFVQVDDVLDESLAVQFGRFVMQYGDQRLIGHLEWVDQGRSYDGFRVFYAPDEDAYVDLFGVRVRDDAIGVTDAQDLVGVYAGLDEITDGLSAEAYALLFRDQMRGAGEVGMGNSQFVTVGTRVFGDAGGFDYTGEFAYQNGDVNDDDLSAYAFAVVAGYTLEDTDWTPRFALEVDYASGNKDGADGDNETFQTLFPTNHLHYGYADLVGWSNIIDFRGTISAKPADTVSVAFDFHHFQLADENGGWINAAGQTIRPGAAGASDELGNEIDLTLKWGVTKALTVQTGWSHFFAGDFVSDTGDDDDADFFYVQAGVKF